LAETKASYKVTQEKLPDSQVGLEIEIPSERSQQAYDQVITQFMRSATIPGFRKGKVPRQVVLQQLGQARIKAAAVEELVQKSLEGAIAQEQIPALGNFQLRSDFDELIEQFQPGAALTFSATVDVAPEAKLGEYTNLKVQAQKVDFDPAKVDEVITEQRRERATLIPVEDRAAQEGDTVLVDFSGRLVKDASASDEDATDEDATEDEPFLGGQADDFQLELLEGRFIAGFAEGIVSMQVGETKEIPVTFPADYFQEELAGQQAVFTVTLKDIKEKELPELDDDFVQEISEFKTLPELQDFLTKRYQNEAEQKTQTNIEAALLSELLKVLEVEIPTTMVKNEVDFLVRQTVVRLQSQGIDVNRILTQDLVKGMQENARTEAMTRIQRTLALAEVAKQQSITVDEAELESAFRASLEQLSDRKIDRDRLRDVIEEDLLEAKVLKWLQEHAQVELVDTLPELPQPVTEAAPVASAQTVNAKAEEVPQAGSTTDAEEANSDQESAANSAAEPEQDASGSTPTAEAKGTKAESSEAPPKARKSRAASSGTTKTTKKQVT
jgi:trigger factor